MAVLGAIYYGNRQDNKKEKKDTLLKLRELELMLNQLLNFNSDNKKSLEKFQAAIKNQGSIIWPCTLPLSINIDSLTPIKNADLLNDLFELFTDISRIDTDYRNLERAIQEEKQLYETQIKSSKNPITTPDPNKYKQFLPIISYLIDFQANLTEKTIHTLSKIRIVQKTPNKLYYPRNMKDMLLKETQELKKEIEQTGIKSQKEIDDIMGS